MTPELSERQVEVLKMVRDRESLQWAGLKNLFDLRAFGLVEELATLQTYGWHLTPAGRAYLEEHGR